MKVIAQGVELGLIGVKQRFMAIDIYVNDIPLEYILTSYDAMHYLLSFASENVDIGGREALDNFDKNRRLKPKNIKIVINKEIGQ